MRKTYRLQDLDCAVCAAKMEEGIRKLDGVQYVSVSFIAQKMVIEADEAGFDGLMQQVKKVCKRIEPDCTIL